jgi:hypothetical protein
MRIEGIAVGDIVRASIGGRIVYGEVLEIRGGVIHFNPISRGAGWRHASAHQIVGHWRRAGRRASAADAADAAGGGAPVVAPIEQLSLNLDPDAPSP